MITVFLAYILFSTMDDAAPKFIIGYARTPCVTALDNCFADARSRNHELDKQPGPRVGGYVCLQMRGEV